MKFSRGNFTLTDYHENVKSFIQLESNDFKQPNLGEVGHEFERPDKPRGLNVM